MKQASFNNSNISWKFGFLICILENVGYFMQKKKKESRIPTVSFCLIYKSVGWILFLRLPWGGWRDGEGGGGERRAGEEGRGIVEIHIRNVRIGKIWEVLTLTFSWDSIRKKNIQKMLAFYSSAGEKVKTEGEEELPEHLRGEGGAPWQQRPEGWRERVGLRSAGFPCWRLTEPRGAAARHPAAVTAAKPRPSQRQHVACRSGSFQVKVRCNPASWVLQLEGEWARVLCQKTIKNKPAEARQDSYFVFFLVGLSFLFM